MSWYRQIKLLYNLSSNMFFYIVYGLISFSVFFNKVDYRFFLIALGTTIFAEFLGLKWNNKALFFLPCILGIVLVFLVSNDKGAMYNSVFIIFCNFIAYYFNKEEISYEIYRERGQKSLAALLIIGILVPIINMDLAREFVKFFVMFVISIIWLLRETRGYAYKMKSKNALLSNIALASGILIMSIDKVFSLIVKAFSVLFNFVNTGLGFILDLILDFIGFIIAKPMMYIINYLTSLSGKSSLFSEENKNIQIVERKPLFEDGGNGLVLPPWINSTIRIIIFIALLYFIYRVLLKHELFAHKQDNRALEEKREKIKRESVSKKGLFEKALKNLFRPKDFRGQILEIYRRFEEKTFTKGFFKYYMTAKQLENVTKAYVDDPDGIASLTDFYNEAKFSNHAVDSEKAKAVKESFNKVKRHL